MGVRVSVVGLGSALTEVGWRDASVQTLVRVMGMVAGVVELGMTVVGWFVAGFFINSSESMQVKMSTMKNIVSDGFVEFGGTRVVIVVVVVVMIMRS